MVSIPVMRRVTIHLLLGLDFAHAHNVIHIGNVLVNVAITMHLTPCSFPYLKPGNIFVKFRDSSRIESGYLAIDPILKRNRAEERYSAIPSRPLRGLYFTKKESKHADEFGIALRDWRVSIWKTQHLTEKIQPVALRSPEALIGAPWNNVTGLCNLGAVVHEVYRDVRLFSGDVPPDGH